MYPDLDIAIRAGQFPNRKSVLCLIELLEYMTALSWQCIFLTHWGSFWHIRDRTAYNLMGNSFVFVRHDRVDYSAIRIRDEQWRTPDSLHY